MKGVLLAPILLGAVLQASRSYAEETSNSPYIDSVRKELKEKDKTPSAASDSGEIDPYIQTLKNKFKGSEEKESSEGYTERLQQELKPPAASDSYTEQQKARLEPAAPGGAIEAFNAGHSELHAKKMGEIHHAAGLKVGASLSRQISSGSSAQPFENIYGQNFPLDLDLFYEYQPWHSDWYGNIGFFVDVGVAYYHGNGAFQIVPHDADSGDPGATVPTTSHTSFQFFSAPIALGIDYRFNLFKYLSPFAMAGGTGVGFYETRNDGGDSRSALSQGFYLSGGVNILMDWVSSDSTWDMYAEHGIKHYYLTVAYSRVQSVHGDVSIANSGIYGGFTFEF